MGWTVMYDHPSSADAYFREQLADGYTVLESATVNLSEYYAATRDNSSGTVDCFVAMIRWSRDSFGYKDMSESMGPGICNAPAKVLDLLSPLPECSHEQRYCRHCGAEITRADDNQWWSYAKEHQHPGVTSPRCYSGYRVASHTPQGGPPLHAPGGTAPCGICWARNWRQECRQNLERRSRRHALLADGATVRLINADAYHLADEIKSDPTFTVHKTGRQTLWAWTANPHNRFRFGRGAEWAPVSSEARAAS
jgi:hypothetical protein